MRNTRVPVRFILGAGPGGVGPTPPQPDPAAPPAQETPANPQPTPNPTDPAPTPTPPAQEADWAKTFEGMTPSEVKVALENSRKWESRSKDNFEKLQQFDTIAKVLNGDATTPPDPAKLSADLAASQRETRETKVENAVLRFGGASGAALVDSRSFMKSIAALDPAAADFETQVKTAVADRLQNSPPASDAGSGVDLYLGHPSSLKTSSRDLGSAEADRRFGAPKT